MNVEILELSEKGINDRKSFIQLLHLLRKDFLANPESWENTNLDRFLEAMEAWTDSAQGYYDNWELKINADEASWRVFSDILIGATMEE